MRRTFLPFAQPYIQKDEIAGVVDTLRSGWLTTGPKTKKFEVEFAKFAGAPFAAAVNSATAGLHLSLEALKVKKGVKVITTPYTFCATANVVLQCGGTLALADVRDFDHNIDPKEIEKKLDKNTKVIMPVHFGGLPADMDSIKQLARKNKCAVVEDAAHAAGAVYKGKKIGSLSDLTVFSFYATKTICTGEGGMVTTSDENLRDRISMLSLHGISKDAWKRYTSAGSWYYEVKYPGFKYNMTDIQAALGLAQLKKAGKMLKLRTETAKLYTKELKDIDGVNTPLMDFEKGTVNAWHLYVVRINDFALTIKRDRFIEEMRKLNIGTSVHFIPLHFHPYYIKTFGFTPKSFPVATKLYRESISLPIYPGMSGQDVHDVINAVKATAKRFKR